MPIVSCRRRFSASAISGGVDHDGAVEVKWSDVVSDDVAHNFIRCQVEAGSG